MAENEMEYAAYPQEQSYRPRQPKWTIMIYLAGDNNLSANTIAIMQELEAANHREDVRVLACFDSNTPRPRGARYLEINHRRNQVDTGMDWGLHNDLVPPEERGDGSIVSPDFCNLNPTSVLPPEEPVTSEGLSRFLRWALRHHRAERHMLVLFGHGTAVGGNNFLADNNPPSFLRLPDFAKILKRYFGGRHKLDVLACDNCVMSTVEVAYEIRKQVDFMIGSQGLMLASGWPFRKIINAIAKNPNVTPKKISRRLLKVCARDLLDFSLMDRSSEQSLCDLRQFHKDNDYDDNTIIGAVQHLAIVLMQGLETDTHTGAVLYPFIRDAVRLARLEAQSYWDETFVDLYDFCKLLAERCHFFLSNQISLTLSYTEIRRKRKSLEAHEKSEHLPEEKLPDRLEVSKDLRDTPAMKGFSDITECCNAVMEKVREFVPYYYYVGAELQYSNGLSIYFPWTLPENPIIFEPTDNQAINFQLKTAFEEYEEYDFAKDSKWAAFLRSFFRATLRDVRRFDNKYRSPKETDDVKLQESLLVITRLPEGSAPPVNLNKSSSDVDSETDCTCPTIKNYPRRFYISPADCLRREILTPAGSVQPSTPNSEPHASYLGWNVRGLVAEAVGLPTPGSGSDEGDDGAE